MQRYNGQLINQFPNTINGNAAAGAQVTIRVKSSGTLATLYATNSFGGETLPNPLTADAKGYYGFYAADGVYTLDVNISGTPQLEIQLQDVADLQAQFNGAVSNAGYIPVGTFAAGCTVSQANGVVSDGSSYWRWDGALPKTVTAGSEPLPVGVGGWFLVGGDGLRGDLAASSSTVLVGGVEAGEIAANYNQADALVFPDGAFWDSPVLSQRTMVDIKNFQGQDGTYPAKEPVIVHDYSDGRRTMQLDKVGGSAADYVLGLRRANNPINRPDKAADYVAPVGYLECSYDSFDGVGGAKLVNKSFYLDPNANLVWTGKNGSVVTSAQFITLKPNGDGRYPFWFTATQEADLFMRFSNPSGDVLAIRDDVSGTRTNILVDSNQTSGLRISCLAGPLDLDAGTNVTIRKPINTAANTDLTLTPSRDLLLNPVSGSTKCDTPFRLRSYSVSSAPSATAFDQHLIYVTNGDAGQPCLAVAQGGVWKRISLGAAISST